MGSSDEYHDSTKKILDKQLGSSLTSTKYVQDTYSTYEDDRDDGYWDTYSANEEKEASALIEMMEQDPSRISRIAAQESVNILSEILRQLLLR